jgi:hypothetical protein
MPSLRSQLDALAANFASQIIAALQAASLHELVSADGGNRAVRNGRRAPVVAGGGGQPDPLPTAPKSRGRSGRLRRRSPEEIAKTLERIVLLVKTHKNGMRAEEIRSKLGMESKEMPRILREGIAKKKFSTKGQKRATTYFAR